MKLAVVGCGFVGSVFTDEFLKRCFAGKLPATFLFIDDDVVSQRNCANQNFDFMDMKKAKAVVLQGRATRFDRVAESAVTRLTLANCDELLDGADLVIDAVDNLETRQLLWGHALVRTVPVLHVGISPLSTGVVEWTYPGHETFSLRPSQTAGRDIKDPESGITPPCELARMRGVGLNVGFAAACAASIFCGFDPEAHLNGKEAQGTFTEWQATSSGFIPQRESWQNVDR